MNTLDPYQQLTTACGFVQLPRTRIELYGRDRASFLHNLCTNDVKSLRPGHGTEAFVTNVQGKTIGHVFVYAQDDRLIVDTVAGQAEFLLGHMDHYLITEDVQIKDVSGNHAAFLLIGPLATGVLNESGASLPADRYGHVAVMCGEAEVHVARVDWAFVPTWFLSVPAAQADDLAQWLIERRAARCDAASWEGIRIESRFPWYGIDMTPQNLPQEVDRNTLAISFHKGCYLGQETVARIDALGHVNRKLVRVRFAGTVVPRSGTELSRSGRAVGRTTSGAYSPRYTAPLSLAYVRSEACAAGVPLQSPCGEVWVLGETS